MTPEEPSAVLVVDDDPALHLVYTRVVKRAGGEAFIAPSGQEAQRLLEERAFVAAVLDKNLPDLSGIELLKVVKQRQPRTEVLVVTGYAGLESAVQALRLGAFDYVEKPFDVEVLAGRLREAMALRRRLTADVAQNVEAPLGRLASELEVVAEVTAKALFQIKSGPLPAELAAPLRDIEQAVQSIADAVESARQIAQALSRTT